MQRRGVVRKLAAVEIGAALDQQPGGGMLVAQNRQVQRRGLLESAAECVDPLRMCVEAGAERVEIAGLRRPHDGLDRLHLLIGPGFASLEIARQDLDRLMPSLLGDLMDRTAVGVGRCGIKARRKGAADGLDVAGACGFENAIAVAIRWTDPVDMRLQRAPAFEAMVMGDLVLLETEITPVMTRLLDSGLDITAIHNHVLRGSPATFYMHVGGHGDPVKLATALRTALAESKTPLTPPAAPATPAPIDLDTAQLDAIIGVKGQANGGVYQFGVPRRDPISENGMQIAPAGPMGVATAINFQPTGGGKAAITGDFVLTGEEVNPVIKALRASGIEVTAVHSHMLTEQPRLIFMHFWANDDALKLAKGLRSALDKTASAKS